MINSPNNKNKKITSAWHLVFLLVTIFAFAFAGQVMAATQWVSDPGTCSINDPTNFPGQNCSPVRICGDSSGIAQCYDTTTLLPPAVSATSNTLYSASYPNGGYLTNCYATKDSAAPYCDNNQAYWCNRSTTCYTTQARDTVCTANTWNTATCGSCRTGFGDCNLDGGVCEIQYGTTNYPTGANNNYLNCTTAQCDTGYLDCDAGGIDVGNGCEIQDGSTCTLGGLTGTWSGCTCTVAKQYFETGTEAQYATTDPLLWGVQFGAGPLITFGNSTDPALFVVENDGSVNLAAISAPGVTTNKLYNIAGSLYWNGVMIGAGASGDGWGLTGNAGTDPLTNFIGTTDAQPLTFRTEDTEWMRITENGYIGMGTESPEESVSIKGDVLIGQNEDMIIPAGGIDRNLYLRSRDGSLPGNQGLVNVTFQRDADSISRIGINNSNSLLLQPYNTGAWQAGLSVASTGNVGVRTNVPYYPLHVASPDSSITAYFEVLDNSRTGVYIGNGGMFSGDESGLYDIGGDVPLAVFDGANELMHYTQNIAVDVSSPRMAVGSYTVDSSAVLSLNSSNAGFLMPRMTTLQRDAIATPSTGLQIYNTTTGQFEYYDGVSWVAVGGGAGSGDTIYTADGSIAANRNVTIDDGNYLRFRDQQDDQNYLYFLSDYITNGNLRIGGFNNTEGGINHYIEFKDNMNIHSESGVEIATPNNQIDLMSSNSNLQIGGQNWFYDNRPVGSRQGLIYADDYSADFVDRSLVDKAYVDSVAGGGTTITSIDFSVASYNGSFSSGGFVGYEAANDICRTDYPGSHFCRTDEIIEYIDKHSAAGFAGSAWIAEGPPGFTSNSNDCNGWTDSDSAKLGAFWSFSSTGGGMGWLTTCSVMKQLACCE